MTSELLADSPIAKIGNRPLQQFTYKRAPNPHYCWPLRDWLLHLEQSLSVNRDSTSKPYQDIVCLMKDSTDIEVQLLVNEFFEKPAGAIHRNLISPLKHSPKLGADLSKLHASLRLLLCQHALSGQGGNLCTFNLNVNEAFLENAGERSSGGDSFTSILNDKIKRELRRTFNARFGPGNYVSPHFWWVLEHAVPDIKGPNKGVQKGIRAFHIHGEIVADNEQLPIVKAGLEGASAGYSSQGNRAVKFGEPFTYTGQRNWPSAKCLSDFPSVARAERSNYCSYWPERYCVKDMDHTETVAARLGIVTGGLWKVSSPLVTREATACLKLLNILVRHTEAASVRAETHG